LCASLCKPVQKDTPKAVVKSAENLVFDIDKERAIKEVVDFLRTTETEYCIVLAKVIKSRLIDKIALSIPPKIE
jgi:hypothetical protein